ncbi:MAG: hypothetical protein ACTHMJ_20915 [Thermomicrobiales bacterium]
MSDETAEQDKALALAALDPMREAIADGRYIFCDAPAAEPGADCWSWLRCFIGLIDDLIKANRLTSLRIIFTYDDRGRR